jgi:putative hydroxymethylpyrimidine transport system substrate-binding protein
VRPATRILPLLAVALTLAACGGGGGAAGERPLTVALDFTPNAVHAPIYAAVRVRADRERGVRIRVRPPGSAPDSLKLLAAGKADLAVLDVHDLGLARERDADLVGVAALVQRPLGALIARPGIERPRDLEGRRVGVSGLPSDPAFVRAIVEHDGGDADRVRELTIGFAAVPSLIEARVDAVPAFWNAEGVVLRERGVRIREFRVEDYGAPPYPEVLLVTSRRTLESRREAIEAALAAIGEGIAAVGADPEAAVAEIAAAGGAEPELVRAQLRAVAPLFEPPLRLDRAVLERWARWDAEVGILRRPADVERAFAFDVADRALR